MHMTVSIFTPTHDSRWLVEAYESIKDQDFDEWVILYTHGATQIDFGDKRVKGWVLDEAPESVGFAKNFCCYHAAGDILLELDHDDLLMPDAVQEVRRAFERDHSVGYVYSDYLTCTTDFQKTMRMREEEGWIFREVEFKGHRIEEVVSFDQTPYTIVKGWFSPIHLRAFRSDAYKAVCGHNPNLKSLDDLDLSCKLYCATKLKHIQRSLYVYRMHESNLSFSRTYADYAGSHFLGIHDRYLLPAAVKWAKTYRLAIRDLGQNLEGQWNVQDDSVGVLRAFNVFQFAADPVHVMLEAYRVLAPGGYLFVWVPSTDGPDGFADPSALSHWNENSFLYYTTVEKNRYIDCPVRFQEVRRYTRDGTAFACLMKMDDKARRAGRILI
jgi:glycosyltransferase involved in cell wall biosynthesis